ncbi:MAG: hypothetical protein E5V74_01720 [Mesorhizobium sp.]|nr:MAG: hypothetical protein E5V74_01720 [Mesorhizobium sp.]
MTVAELIAKLSEFPSDMLVVVSGFDEGGFDNIDTIEKVRIFDTTIGGKHSGRYEEDKRYARLAYPNRGEGFEALHINF